MKVPIFPADLERNTGVKRAARFLFKTWPGAKPIIHTEALDILARGLGYQNYHEVTKQGLSWTEARPDLDINVIDWNISHAMSDELQAPGNPRVSINLGNLLAYIQTIPLHHLTIFKLYPELQEGRNSFPLLPYDAQSAFGRFQHSPVIPLEGDWRIPDDDEGGEPGQL
jgi:hypothetical protein